MRKSIIYLLSVLCALLIVSCGLSTKPGRVNLRNYADSLSYALGFLYGLDIAEAPFDFNHRMIYKGMVNAQNIDLEILTEEQITSLLDRFQGVLESRRNENREILLLRNQADGQRYMEENAKREGVRTTESGLQYRVIRSGGGRQVRANSDVTVHYTGSFLSGEIFDSSFSRSAPLSFNVDHVIAGWSEGLQLMRVGDVFEFVIPDSLAYGTRGFDIIEPGAYLVFEVEVISIDN